MSCGSNDSDPNHYKIEVQASGLYNGVRAQLQAIEGANRMVTDTAVIINGKFKFEGYTDGVALRTLTVNGVMGQLPIILEPGQTKILLFKDSITKSKISGTPNNATFNKFKLAMDEEIKILNDIREKYKIASMNKNQNTMQGFRDDYNKQRLGMSQTPFNFIKKHPGSAVSLLLLNDVSKSSKDLDQIREAYNTLSHLYYQNNNYKIIANAISKRIDVLAAVKRIAIGEKVPNFSAPDPQGNSIELESVKGKVTIIDFWASWCRPCRLENPNLVRIYKKFKDKGLEIISVSLDRPQQKQAWISAIESDNLDWFHVSNLKYFRDPIAEIYGVNSIPATFIIDQNSKLIATRLRGKALENKIAELLQ